MTLTASSVATDVRFLCGELDTDAISDTSLETITQAVIDDLGDDDDLECEVNYESVLRTLLHLMRMEMMSNGSSTSETSRKEIRGKTTIEVEYDEDDESGWENMYNLFLMNPDWVCSSLVENRKGVVLIGGVSKSDSRKARRGRDNKTPFDVNVGLNYNVRRQRHPFPRR